VNGMFTYMLIPDSRGAECREKGTLSLFDFE